MNKKILLLILVLCVLTIPTVSHGETTIKTMVDNLAGNLKDLGGSLAIIGFVVAGIMYISSTANPQMMATAKSALVAAVIGVVILILATTAKDFVNGLFFK